MCWTTREIAIGRFKDAHIPWHVGVGGGPTNHLCSSQVQCVNSLAPFANNPDALKQIFGALLDIAEMLPMRDPLAPEDFVVFEWIGTQNLLHEWKGVIGTRGANNTSADAAIRYRACDGKEELAILEWKYVEQYKRSKGLHGSASAMATRDARYRHLFDACDGPLRQDLLPYHDLYVEPLYQLMRLQLLARALEKCPEEPAERVRVVLCAPAANTEFWDSLSPASHRNDAGNVGTLWKLMQRDPKTFVLFDTAELVTESAPTSAEYKQRYGHLADAPALGVPNPFVE